MDTNGNGLPDEFLSDFNIVDAILAASTPVAGRPLVLSAEYMHNFGADIDRDQGWVFGAAYGSARRQGDTRIYYQWQVIEQDAVFSPFVQDDFILATNHRSHLFGIQYQLTDNIGAHLWNLISSRDHRGDTATTDSDSPQWRVRFELNVKF